MQECRVCGLLFLGGGACPSCGSQVAMDITVDDIVMDDDTIPGLEEIADAIGDATVDVDKSEVLPFGLGAKAEVIESSLPFGVGSFTSDVNEVAIPYSQSDDQPGDIDEETQIDSVKPESVITEQKGAVESFERNEPTAVVEETGSVVSDSITMVNQVQDDTKGRVIQDDHV